MYVTLQICWFIFYDKSYKQNLNNDLYAKVQKNLDRK